MPEPAVLPSTIAQKFRSLVSIIPTATVALVTIACWFLIHRFNEGKHEPQEEIEIHTPEVVMLSGAKLDAANLESEPAQSQPIQDVFVVPGRIQYDEAKHIEVKAPMDGILSEIFVTPGQPVELGQLIAVIRSAEIGQARAAIVKQEQQRQIAARTLQRETTTANNLSLLTSMLDEGKSIQSIGETLNNLELGSYRQEILSTYSKMLLSSELLAKIEPLANSGSIAGRLFRERETERQLAETAFRTARDQAKYQAEQAKLQAAAEYGRSGAPMGSCLENG
jgi:membrane fusion protein, heavy metal efflux system